MEQERNKKIKENLNNEQKKCVLEIYKWGEQIANIRGKPLLLMFYSREESSQISEDDIYELEQKLSEKIPDGIKELDVCIQTTGGDANASYLLAQLIRSYCKSMNIFVPNYSYSGGTLISLASDNIFLGRTARLSPIDLQLSFMGEDSPEPFALVNIEKYIDFILDCCDRFKFRKEENKTNFIIPLVKSLVNDYGTNQLGELFRMRGLTEFHARILLMDYMYKNEPEKRRKVDWIIRRLTSESPTHNFEIDYNIAKNAIGLKVQIMEENIYKPARHLINICGKSKRLGLICDFIGASRRPFFEVFVPTLKRGGENGN